MCIVKQQSDDKYTPQKINDNFKCRLTRVAVSADALSTHICKYKVVSCSRIKIDLEASYNSTL